MNETVVTEPALPGVFARFIGIITSPKDTFVQVVRAPRSIGILALVALLTGVSISAFSLTEKGRQAQVDFSVQQMEKFGMTVNDDMYAGLEKRSKYTPYTTMVSM